MTSRTYLRRAAAGGLAAVLLAGLPGAAASAASAAPQGDPPGTTYVYRATFSATVTHALFVDWADGDSDEQTLEVRLQGAIPSITMDQALDLTSTSIPTSVVKVVAAQAEGVTRTNSGQHVRTCTASSGTATGKPVLWPDPLLQTNDFVPFAFLELPGSCTDSEGPPSATTFEYEAMLALTHGGPAGAPSLSLPFRVERGTAPLTRPDECPGYIAGQTPVCHYAIEGTLDLHLLRKVPPAPPKPPAPPRGAVLAPGAKKVTAGVRCPARCTVTLKVTPLSGGPTLAVRKVTPSPGRVTTVKVAIPPGKRGLVKKAGGVRLRLTYRHADGTTSTETRKARR
ncbi:hypothetical protein [Pimelobacter sp. 30-1]|uniref:hypothetical protein n=1 Tax=Pimelobacter sp. 30-1 TaxID=2004991 RepID=UPI001C04AF4E|nr:hypothetical protein [Pimelobacter sp. 30-1]MBU2696636.1 hypothetical protein [Pimelobacter sp. 30-1]